MNIDDSLSLSLCVCVVCSGETAACRATILGEKELTYVRLCTLKQLFFIIVEIFFKNPNEHLK